MPPVNTEHRSALYYSLRFTLIEMLVVIAIIGILASMLMPALTKALHSAKQVNCSNNFRQLYVAIFSYIGDNNNFMPTYNGGTGTHYALMNTYIGEQNDTAWGVTTSYVKIEPRGIFFCPEITTAFDSPCWSSGSNVGSRYMPNYCVTGQSPMSNGGKNGGCWTLAGGSPSYNPLPERRLGSIMNGTVIMGEKNYYCSTGMPLINYTGRLYAGGSQYWPSEGITNAVNTFTIGWNLHSSSANFLFKDGHVDSRGYTADRVFDKDFKPVK